MEQEITRDQLEVLKLECQPSVSVATRQVPGGYIVSGQVAWAKDGNVVAIQRDECVCVAYEDVAPRINNYHEQHTFVF